MKVALVISSLSTGGAERVISLLANHWASRGDDVDLITVDSRASDCYPSMPLAPVSSCSEPIPGGRCGPANTWRDQGIARALAATGRIFLVLASLRTSGLLATRFTDIRVLAPHGRIHRHRGAIWQVLRRRPIECRNGLVATESYFPAQAVGGKQRPTSLQPRSGHAQVTLAPLERKALSPPRDACYAQG